MNRRRLSTRDRAAVFATHEGVCCFCRGRIQAGERWHVHHETPLELGGADDCSNWVPAHEKCHRSHTAAVDVPNIARAKRLEAKHFGAHTPSRRVIPGSKRSSWKRTIDGKVVPRLVKETP